MKMLVFYIWLLAYALSITAPLAFAADSVRLEKDMTTLRAEVNVLRRELRGMKDQLAQLKKDLSGLRQLLQKGSSPQAHSNDPKALTNSSGDPSTGSADSGVADAETTKSLFEDYQKRIQNVLTSNYTSLQRRKAVKKLCDEWKRDLERVTAITLTCQVKDVVVASKKRDQWAVEVTSPKEVPLSARGFWGWCWWDSYVGAMQHCRYVVIPATEEQALGIEEGDVLRLVGRPQFNPDKKQVPKHTFVISLGSIDSFIALQDAKCSVGPVHGAPAKGLH